MLSHSETALSFIFQTMQKQINIVEHRYIKPEGDPARIFLVSDDSIFPNEFLKLRHFSANDFGICISASGRSYHFRTVGLLADFYIKKIS